MVRTEKKTTVKRKTASHTRFTFVAGSLIVGLIVLMSVFPQLFTKFDPEEVSVMERLVAPTLAHPFGTDSYGRDIFARVVYGARIDLMLGVLGTIVPFFIGGVAGMLAGYYGGLFDTILMGLIDIMMAFPFTILVIVIISILGNGIINVYIALWLVGWMAYAKLVRGEVLILKSSDYIQAAKVAGFSDKRILLRHMLPNVISSAVVYAVSDIVLCMLTGASMSFLGLGVQPPTPEWGAIMNEGKSYISYAWWITILPGLMMAVTGIGFSLLGDGLTDYLRRKGR